MSLQYFASNRFILSNLQMASDVGANKRKHLARISHERWFVGEKRYSKRPYFLS
jgi:hypothetical protein